MSTVLGLDLGGTKLLACALGCDGSVRFRRELGTGRFFGPQQAFAAMDCIVSEVDSVLGPVQSIGIGFPGLVDFHAGVVRSSVILEGWSECPLVDLVSRRYGVRCCVDNDVNAAAHCERVKRSVDDLLYVAVGTGIGGALVLSGEVWRGARGYAGEIGHVSIDLTGPLCECGRRGCVNLYASGTAIESALGLRQGALRRKETVDERALLTAVERAGDSLGAAIGSVLNMLDVTLVVLGGGVVRFGECFVDAVANGARRECFTEIGMGCVFEPAQTGYDAAAIGAAMLALELDQSKGQPASVPMRWSTSA